MLLALIIPFNVKSQDKLVKYTAAGDSMIKYGYSIEPIIANEEMLPKPFVKIGNYLQRIVIQKLMYCFNIKFQ